MRSKSANWRRPKNGLWNVDDSFLRSLVHRFRGFFSGSHGHVSEKQSPPKVVSNGNFKSSSHVACSSKFIRIFIITVRSLRRGRLQRGTRGNAGFEKGGQVSSVSCRREAIDAMVCCVISVVLSRRQMIYNTLRRVPIHYNELGPCFVARWVPYQT